MYDIGLMKYTFVSVYVSRNVKITNGNNEGKSSRRWINVKELRKESDGDGGYEY